MAPGKATPTDELTAARRERDEALAALARERELVNALRLQLKNRGEPDVPHFPPGTAPGKPPLRYELADRINESAKKALAPVHFVARRLLDRKK